MKEIMDSVYVNKRLHSAVATLLDINSEFLQLHEAIKELRVLFLHLSPILAAENREMLSEETQLPSGLAIAPDFAATILSDTKRTVKFLRGVKEAIDDCLEIYINERIHLLYAGCGPYATLVLPLLHFFRPDQLKVTLLDIHQLSLDSVEAIAHKIGVTDCIDSLICCNASRYLHPEDDPIHMVVTETMAQLLYKEPQVSITLNLVPQMVPNGILIPEEVIISLRAIDTDNNYLRLTNRLPENGKVEFLVKDIFILDKNSPNLIDTEIIGQEFWLNDCIIPAIPQQFNQLQLFTEIKVYNNHFLKAYESGLTSPLDCKIDEIKEGDRIAFHYRICQIPELRYTKKGGTSEKMKK